MQLETLDILFNILMFFMWFAIWPCNNRDLVFNPYLTRISLTSDAIINFLKPVFFKTPKPVIAVSALLFVILFRATIFHSMIISHESSWQIPFGWENIILSGKVSMTSSAIFSLVSFVMFIFNIWGISVLYLAFTRNTPGTRIGGMMYNLCHPCIIAPLFARPVIIIAIGSLVSFLLHLTHPQIELILSLLALDVSKTSIISFIIRGIAGWVNIIPILQQTMLILIIGSWLSSMTASRSLASICTEWIDFLLGPLRRYHVSIGLFDITPLLFIVATWLIHGISITVLSFAYKIL